MKRKKFEHKSEKDKETEEREGCEELIDAEQNERQREKVTLGKDGKKTLVNKVRHEKGKERVIHLQLGRDEPFEKEKREIRQRKRVIMCVNEVKTRRERERERERERK